jgi:jasmonate ZIM domain-containing protein
MNLFPVVEKPMKSQIETKQPERSQMTIFYNGKVIVFNDFPADKANDLVQLAVKNNSPNLVAPKLAPVNVVQRPPQPIPELQLPIARNASLQRFLEKRKDRIAAKAPYQLNKSKNENNSSWLGLAAAQSSLQFGLQ